MRLPFAASLLVALLAASAAAQTPLTTTRVASGLSKPLWVGSPPGDNRLFVVEQMTANIRIIENGLPLPTPFLNLTAKVLANANERGLLGLAFDPDYQNNHFFYVFYTRKSATNDGDEVVERYTAIDEDDADPNSGVIILGPVTDPQSNHNGGNVRFGPDGLLWTAIGDGGAANDTGPGHVPITGNAQSGTTLLGKLIHINTDGTPAANNPFLSPTDGFLDQIWAYGLRNPWRWSFDRLTGDLWIGDVGQDLHEEIDFQPASSIGGENYGWHCMEGFACTGFGGCTCNDPSLTLPIQAYDHTSGNCSVTGGYVYRGSAIPDLQGTYFYADYCTARIWSMTYNGVSIGNFQDRTAQLAPGVNQFINLITSFGETNDGELLIVDQGGEIFQIVKNPWTNLGSALPGIIGPPQLTGEGGLVGNSSNRVRLAFANANAPAVLFVALSVGGVPFKGGNLVPSAFFLTVPATTTASGTFDLPFTFPTGVPSGVPLVFQYAIKDAAAVAGVSLSNALQGLTP